MEVSVKPLDNHLRDLLAGQPVSGGAAPALRAAMWVLNQRLMSLERDIVNRSPRSDLGDYYQVMLARRLQLQEDLRALEALLARAEMRPDPEKPFNPPSTPGGHGYGEA